MAPWPIKSLRTVRVFYLVYGLGCVAWWGLYGTLQAVTATSSGFESCLSMSPTLYLFSQYEVASFWVVFIAAVGFFVNEKTARMRQNKLDQWTHRKEATQRAKQLQEQEIHDRVLQEAQEEARRLEEEQRQKVEATQKQLYEDEDGRNNQDEDSDGVDEYNPAIAGSNKDDSEVDGQQDEDEQHLPPAV
ncbi:unnamed protein product [Phytophthora fragariaefolia]|uniref:Unnamed protein product n=1 Tax=Phytophthora fragariaefolia TaxID=1490495 RepID=A0A9W7D760_9STRA|nr:unnamed protein product [Phytophthora fragariaefolia]